MSLELCINCIKQTEGGFLTDRALGAEHSSTEGRYDGGGRERLDIPLIVLLGFYSFGLWPCFPSRRPDASHVEASVASLTLSPLGRHGKRPTTSKEPKESNSVLIEKT